MTPAMVLGLLLLSLAAIAVAGIVGLRALVLQRAAAYGERGGAEADGLPDEAASLLNHSEGRGEEAARGLAEAAEGWGGAEPPEAPPSQSGALTPPAPPRRSQRLRR